MSFRTTTEHLIQDMDNLRHMLGVRSDKPRKQWCYRNYFNSEPGSDTYESMVRLVVAGLATQYRLNYFCATLHGCMAIGLSAKETQKALEPK